jgi:probable F420-dependent oxidoreductase
MMDMKVRFALAPSLPAVDGPDLLAFTNAVEASGFDGVWLSDLPLGPALDPLLGLAVIAGATTRVRLGANVVPLGRNPFLLAKELAQLDQLSGGRVLLSFVPGLGAPGERAILGLDGAGRGALLEASLQAVRAWWQGDAADDPALRAVVRPVQDPLEVWLGGRGPKALERVGRVADGWLGAAVTPAEAPGARAQILAAAQRAARPFDLEHFGLSIPYVRNSASAAALAGLRALRADVDPYALLPVGADGLRTFLLGYLEAGLSKFVLRPSQPPTSWADEVAWLADAVLDLQS